MFWGDGITADEDVARMRITMDPAEFKNLGLVGGYTVGTWAENRSTIVVMTCRILKPMASISFLLVIRSPSTHYLLDLRNQELHLQP